MSRYEDNAVDSELAALAGTAPGGQDIAINRAALALTGMAKGWHLDGAAIRARFIATVLDLERAGSPWTERDAIQKWQRAMRDSKPRAPLEPNGAARSNGAAGVHRTQTVQASKDAADLPIWTAPGPDGKPEFKLSEDFPAVRGELRRHVYRRGGIPVKIKVKYETKDGASWLSAWRVRNKGGRTGWQLRKPAGYVPCPYWLVGEIDPLDDEMADQRLYFCEGEKDAETLARAGLCAITFGSASEIVQCSTLVAQRHIAVLGDNDAAGQKFAKAQGLLLLDAAASVRTFTFPGLPPGGDVTDWLEAGHNGNDLEALIAALPVLRDETWPFLKETELRRGPAPERLWLVPDWIPWRDVTAIGSDGGVGKTTLALQLAIACAAGEMWLGHRTRQCPVIYLSAEDDRDELHFRLEQIAKARISSDTMAEAGFVVLAGKDSILALPGPDGGMVPTPLMERLKKQIAASKAGAVILDSTADVYGGNENDRSQVRSFITVLRAIAIEHSCAVILLIHPSVDALKTGRGYSGSTHWNNAVRSRMYFTVMAGGDDEDYEPDPDLRVLELAKANRARRGQKMLLRWKDHVFEREIEREGTIDSLQRSLDCEAKFLELLAEMDRQGRKVYMGKNQFSAATIFAKHPSGKDYKYKEYDAAIEILLSGNKIKLQEEGPLSKRQTRIVRA